MIAAGMKNGEMRPGPPCSSFECSRSITSNPPMPLATYTPVSFRDFRRDFQLRHAHGEIRGRQGELDEPAHFLQFFFLGPVERIEIADFPGDACNRSAVASKWVMERTPLFPARRFFQTSSVPIPRPQTSPTPVTTTRRLTLINSLLVILRRPANYFLAVRACDVVDGVLHGGDLFGVFVGNFDAKGLFKGHHQFDRVQGIRAQIVHKGSGGGHFAFIHSKLLHNNLLYAFIDTGHSVLPPICAMPGFVWLVLELLWVLILSTRHSMYAAALGQLNSESGVRQIFGRLWSARTETRAVLLTPSASRR